jgi:hypothetical protein
MPEELIGQNGWTYTDNILDQRKGDYRIYFVEKWNIRRIWHYASRKIRFNFNIDSFRIEHLGITIGYAKDTDQAHSKAERHRAESILESAHGDYLTGFLISQAIEQNEKNRGKLLKESLITAMHEWWKFSEAADDSWYGEQHRYDLIVKTYGSPFRAKKYEGGYEYSAK